MIAVFKAQPVHSEGEVADLNLVATKTFPYLEDPKEAAQTHETDATFIVSAMLASLPGGTVDAVLRQLLTHRASLLRVRWPR